MPKHSLAVLALVLIQVFLQSCSDSTSPDNNGNNNNDGNGGGNGEFAVAQVTPDSVYWLEEVTLSLKHAAGNTFNVKLNDQWIHITHSIRDATGNATLRFLVPENSESGELKVFDHTQKQAKGTAYLTIYPQTRENAHSEVLTMYPYEGYSGDLIVVTGRNFPLRRSDMKLEIGNAELVIESWDREHIFARATDAVTAGPLEVTTFGEKADVGYFLKHEKGGELFEEGTVSIANLQAWGLLGIDRREYKSSSTVEVKDTLTPAYENLGFLEPGVVTSTDSIRFRAEQYDGSITRVVEASLKAEPDNRVSGIIRFTYDTFDRDDVTVIELKGMRWLHANGQYYVYAHAHDLNTQLRSFTFDSESGTILDKRVFQRASADGMFKLNFYPYQ